MEFRRTLDVLESGIQSGLHLGGQLYVSRFGNTLIDNSFGRLDDERPAAVDSLFLWRSAGKPLTAIAIAQLVERGILDWNQPIAQLIPEFAQGGKSSITIAHVLTHTAGFQKADLINEELSSSEQLQEICATPIKDGWEIGKHAGYQTWSGWQILAELIHRVTESPFTDHIPASVLKPAGMESTHVGVSRSEYPKLVPRISPFYTSIRGTLSQTENLNSERSITQYRPGSNTRAPARDFGRFYEALLGYRDAPLISRQTLEHITRRHREGLFDRTFQHVIDLGLGFVLNSNRHGIDTVPYGYGPFASDQAFGHSGAQCSCAFADPAHDLVVAWVVNGAPGEPRHQKRARDINAAIYEDLGLAG